MRNVLGSPETVLLKYCDWGGSLLNPRVGGELRVSAGSKVWVGLNHRRRPEKGETASIPFANERWKRTC